MILILVAWILPLLKVSGSEVACEFPAFLQSVEDDDGSLLAWNTRRWWLHLRHKPTWAEKQHVYVRGSHLWRQREQSLKACQGGHRRRSFPLTSSLDRCSDRQLVYNRTCIALHGTDRYQVIQYNTDRTHYFTCMRFVRRSNDVVQVYEGSTSESNNEHLCDDNRLDLDEWPWVAPWKNSPYFCPITGGFTFRTIRRLTNEDLCESEWRRSHLEIECVRGDGLHFMTPAGAKCNLFDKHHHFKKLDCWAGWEDDDYIFLVAADRNQPRYCLRFPKDQSGEFSVLVYFSVICPTERDGKPPQGIEYYELRMRRKDVFSCEDEDDQRCVEVADDGLCSRSDHWAKHCPRSCGLCEDPTVDEERGRCWFDPRLYGDWVLYEADRTEDVFMSRYNLSFSLLGNFQCDKVISEPEYRYKTTSRFRNGCSKRFTCFEFKRRNNNVLQYRVGRSSREDGDAEALCHFVHDPGSLAATYRSSQFKNLILARNLWPSYCGLDSNIPFNGTWGGSACEGQLGDWAPDTCTTRGTVVLRSESCAALVIPQEFQCLDFIPAEGGSLQQQLITRSMDGRNEYNCWIISNEVEGPRWPRRVVYRLPTPQCSLPYRPDSAPDQPAPTATLYLDDKSRSKVCRLDEEQALTTQGPTPSTDLKYVLPDNPEGGGTHVQLSPRPQADGSSPTPPTSLGSQGGSSGLRPCRLASCLTTLLASVCLWWPARHR